MLNLSINYSQLEQILGKNSHEIISTIILITISLLSYYALTTYIKKQEWDTSRKRSTIFTIRNWGAAILILGLLFTWGGEIKTFILSISAITAGILITFKEILLSVASSFIITSNKLFSIGDYIEIDGVRGQVVDKNFTHTKILIQEKINTGKELTLQNSFFITNKFVNLSKLGNYGTYFVNICTESQDNIILQKEILLKSAESIHNKYYENINLDLKKITDNDDLMDVPNDKPYVFIDITEQNNKFLRLKFFCKHKDLYKIEQQIIIKYLSLSKKYQGGEPPQINQK